MTPTHIVIEVYRYPDGSKPSHLWAAKVHNPSQTFHEEFLEGPGPVTEQVADLLEHLLTWMFDGSTTGPFQLVVCNPSEFYPLTEGHRWINAHHSICFASYVSALAGTTVEETRSILLPVVESATPLERIRRVAKQFAAFLKATTAIEQLVIHWPGLRSLLDPESGS